MLLPMQQHAHHNVVLPAQLNLPRADSQSNARLAWGGHTLGAAVRVHVLHRAVFFRPGMLAASGQALGRISHSGSALVPWNTSQGSATVLDYAAPHSISSPPEPRQWSEHRKRHRAPRCRERPPRGGGHVTGDQLGRSHKTTAFGLYLVCGAI